MCDAPIRFSRKKAIDGIDFILAAYWSALKSPRQVGWEISHHVFDGRIRYPSRQQFYLFLEYPIYLFYLSNRQRLLYTRILILSLLLRYRLHRRRLLSLLLWRFSAAVRLGIMPLPPLSYLL